MQTWRREEVKGVKVFRVFWGVMMQGEGQGLGGIQVEVGSMMG